MTGCRVVCHWRELHILDLDIAALQWGSINSSRCRLGRCNSYQLSALQHLPILPNVHLMYLQVSLTVLRDLDLLALRNLGYVEMALRDYLDLSIFSYLVDLNLLGVGQCVV